jgi:hypothetical protein
LISIQKYAAERKKTNPNPSNEQKILEEQFEK